MMLEVVVPQSHPELSLSPGNDATIAEVSKWV